MPTLHLPAAHTDTDLALAAEVANAVGSQDLYVSWTFGEGPGLPPEVQALLRDDRQQGPFSPFTEVLVAIVESISAVWHAIFHRSSPRPATLAPSDTATPAWPAAEESSA